MFAYYDGRPDVTLWTRVVWFGVVSCLLQWDPEPIEEGVDLLEIGPDALVNQIKKVRF